MQTNTNKYDSNGFKHGLWVETFAILGLKFFNMYDHGKLNGEQLIHFDGRTKPTIVGFFKNDKRSGLWKHYNDKEEINRIEFYAD